MLSILQRVCLAIENHVGIQRWLRICCCSLLLINIFSRPYWSYASNAQIDWYNPQLYPSFGVSTLPLSVSQPLLLLFSLGCAIAIFFVLNNSNPNELSSRIMVLKYVSVPLVATYSIALVVNIVYICTNAAAKPCLTISPIEAFILLSLEPCVTCALYSTMIRVQPYFFALVFLLFCIVVSWTALGMVIVNGANEAGGIDPFFNTFGTSIWNMLVVLNAANWPNPMIPSYNINRGYFFFFFAYVLIVQWGFLSLILGLIISFFEDTWDACTDLDEVATKTRAPDLSSALLDQQSIGSHVLLEGATVHLHQGEQALNEASISQNTDIRLLADKDSTLKFNESAFFHCDLRKMYANEWCLFGTDLCALALSVAFCVSSMPQIWLILFLCYSAIDLVLSAFAREANLSLRVWLFLPRFLFNAAWFACMFVVFWMYIGICSSDGGNLSSSFANVNSVSSSVFGTQCQASDLNHTLGAEQNRSLKFSVIVIRTLVLIRMMAITRNFCLIWLPEWIRVVFQSANEVISRSVSSLQKLVLLICVFIYAFSAVGMLLFGGLITFSGAGNPSQDALNISSYGQSEYWPLNFNDMLSGMTTMFTLLYVNNMNVTASGFSAVTSAWAEMFFLAWYVFGVLFCMNIFAAFVWSRAAQILDLMRRQPAVAPKVHEIVPGAATPPQVSKSGHSGKLHHRDSGLCDPIPDKVPASVSLPNTAQRSAFDDVYRVSDAVSEANRKSNCSFNSFQQCAENAIELQISSATHRNDNSRGESPKLEIDDISKGRKEAMRQWIKGTVDMSAYERAAALLQFARHGEVHTLFSTKTALYFFRLRCKITYQLQIASWLVNLLRVIQDPAWMILNPGRDRLMYPVALPDISAQLLCGLKFPLYAILLFGIGIELVYKLDGSKCSNASRITVIMRFLLTFLILLKTIVAIVGLSNNINAQALEWYLSMTSVIYIFWFDRNALRKLFLVFNVVPKLFFVAFCLLLFVLIMAASADFVFNLQYLPHKYQDVGDDDYYDGGYYINFGESVWNTYVAVTSSSFPNQLVPGLDGFREFSVFIIILISCGSFLILDTALATVNFEFKRAISMKHANEDHVTAELMISAYRILIDIHAGDANVNRLQSRALTAEQTASRGEKVHLECALRPSSVDSLFDELFDHYTLFRNYGILDTPQRTLFYNVLDINGDGVLCKHDFMFFLDCLRVSFKPLSNERLKLEHRKRRDLEAESGTTNCAPVVSKSLKSQIQFYRRHFFAHIVELRKPEKISCLSSVIRLLSFEKRYWDTLFDTIGCLLCVFIIVPKRNAQGANVQSPADMLTALIKQRDLITVLLVFFCFEFLLKWLTRGMTLYSRDYRNRFDALISALLFVVFLTALFANVFNSVVQSGFQSGVHQLLEIVVVMRLMVYPRNIACFVNPIHGISWGSILKTIGKLIFTFAEVFFCIAFTFAQIGCALFGGDIPVAGVNKMLDRSPYGLNNFYTLNFNDLPSSLYTLFSCLRVSDFDVITSGFVVVSSDGARLFFVLWYLVGSLLLFNIAKSYFIEVFSMRKKTLRSAIPLQKNPEPTSHVSEASSDDAKEEFEYLEKMNVKYEFIIHLSALAKSRFYISKRSKGTTIITQPPSTSTPTHDHDEQTGVTNPLQPENSAGYNSTESGIVASKQLEAWESDADSSVPKEQFCYTARLKFVQDMKPDMRLQILRRLNFLSDLSRQYIDRTPPPHTQSA